MNISVLGVVGNMSYFLIPETAKKIEIWGQSKGKEMAKSAEAPLLGKIPLDTELARLCEEGKIELYESDIVSELSQTL